MSKRLSYVLVGLAAGVLLALGCNESPNPRLFAATPSPTSPPTVETAPSPTPSPTPDFPTATAPTPAPVPGEYDSQVTLQKLYSGPGHSLTVTVEALLEASASRDASMVKPILDLLLLVRDGSLYPAFFGALNEITGELTTPELDEWIEWIEWVSARLDQFPSPAGYTDWKIRLLALVSPRYQDFLGSADETARIDIFELVWGGVAPDGIPDLQFAPTIPADQADYLNGDDRVFGVSINGHHRAYPHRIMNPHEMANDVVGGEQIALAY